MERAIRSGHFVERVFRPEEIEYCRKAVCPERGAAASFAAVFAAKEAFCKASGVSLARLTIGGGMTLLHGENGAPRVVLSGRVADVLPAPLRVMVSLTHDGDYAAAVVVLELLK